MCIISIIQRVEENVHVIILTQITSGKVHWPLLFFFYVLLLFNKRTWGQ